MDSSWAAVRVNSGTYILPVFIAIARSLYGKMACCAVGALLMLACSGQNVSHKEATLKDGDLIFHSSQSAQSKAIELATSSPYSHMGVLIQLEAGMASAHGEWYVLEAIQPVVLTPIKQWIARGRNGHYVVKRLKEAESLLTEERRKAMLAYGQQQLGKDYDLYFGWSDERMYCSELVWKMYKETADIEIGALQRLGDFDLSHPEVRALISKRYGEHEPEDEPVISPGAMYESSLLYTVVER